MAALATIVLVSAWALFRPKAIAPVAWQGYAEADFVKVGPTQQGLVMAVYVARGDHVVKGQPLFDQDDADDRAAVEQARRLLQQARDQLANILSPAKPTEIEQAKAKLRDAEAARDRAHADLQRNAALLKTGSATQQTVDQEEADLRSSEAKVAAATAALATAQAPMGRPGEIEGQKSLIDSLEAALKQAEWRLDQRSVVSPDNGTVAYVIAFPGETLSAGAPVISLLPSQNIFVRFFIPEPQLAWCMSATRSCSRATIVRAVSAARSLSFLRKPNTPRRSSTRNRRAASSSSWPKRDHRRRRRPFSILASR
jgi:HlyD family secretion protein